LVVSAARHSDCLLSLGDFWVRSWALMTNRFNAAAYFFLLVFWFFCFLALIDFYFLF